MTLTDNFDLFMRLMDEAKYDGFLFGDISAIPIFTRISVFPKLLAKKEIHHRLVNGRLSVVLIL